jgi:hypothetical protein
VSRVECRVSWWRQAVGRALEGLNGLRPGMCCTAADDVRGGAAALGGEFLARLRRRGRGQASVEGVFWTAARNEPGVEVVVIQRVGSGRCDGGLAG